MQLKAKKMFAIILERSYRFIMFILRDQQRLSLFWEDQAQAKEHNAVFLSINIILYIYRLGI